MTAQVIYKGNLRTEMQHLQSGSIVETDAPVDNQGKGERFSPTDLVASALGSCMLTIMGIKARDLGIDLAGVKLNVKKVMVADPRRIGAIHIEFYFPNEFVVDDKTKTILERAALTCPVYHSLHPEIKKETTFNWN